MPAGHLLSEGQYINRNVSEDELWSVFSRLFSAQSKNSTSYKFAFLKSLLDNLYNVDSNLQLTFDVIFAKFAESYWNLVLKYGIRQQSINRDGRISAIEGILREAATRFHIADGVPFEQLNDDAMIFVCDNTKRKCKINVVGALYADLGGMAYSFSRSGEWLLFSPYMYEFLCKHKLVIEKMNYYEWARYMEKVNDDSMVVHLLTVQSEVTYLYTGIYYMTNLSAKGVFTVDVRLKNLLFMLIILSRGHLLKMISFGTLCLHAHNAMNPKVIIWQHRSIWNRLSDEIMRQDWRHMQIR